MICFVFQPRLVAKLGQDKLALLAIVSFVGLFKLLPILGLFVLLLMTTLTTSNQCQQGSVCYSMLAESLWALVGMTFLEVLPTLFMINFLVEDMARKIWWTLSKFNCLYVLCKKLAKISKANRDVFSYYQHNYKQFGNWTKGVMEKRNRYFDVQFRQSWVLFSHRFEARSKA